MIMKKVPKWGFGMAPFKPSTKISYKKSILSVIKFVNGSEKINEKEIIDEISKVKGLFSRIKKQDQWDWFTVNMYMDYPLFNDIVRIVFSLASLRKAILEKKEHQQKHSLNILIHSNFLKYCENFLAFNVDTDNSVEYLYILSRKEEREILKIGMTTRNVQKRVNEINSATGIVYPFSARKVYKVKNARLVETEVHKLLLPYRIRKDREFFYMNFAEACKIIEEYLKKSDQMYYN